MSLQVWLPLNGDLENQGLSAVEVANTGATVVAAGKIGQCYQFGPTAKQYLTISKEAMTSFTTEASVCFWFKVVAWNTSYATFFQAGLGSIAWTNYIFGFLRNNAASTCCFTISNGSSASNASYLTPAFDLDKWYHVALVYKTGHCLIYIDGELYRDYTTSIVPNFAGITTITTGICNNKSSYQTNCQMNDLRIYDHALSAKEVEELSRGLILHYKLDDKYVESTTNLCNSLVAGGKTAIVNNTVINTGENADTYWYIKPKEALIGGATYTVSCELSGFNSDSTYISWGVGAQSGTNCAGSWKCYNGFNEFTFTMPSNRDGSTANFIFDDNGGVRTEKFTISNVQLEQKDHATGYAGMGGVRENETIYDSSGYGYDGTILNSIEIIEDTPRYDKAIHFPTTSSKVYVQGLKTTGFNNSYSFTWWGKINAFSGRMFWGFADGIRLNGVYNGNLWNTGDGSNNPLYKPGTTTQVTAPSVNEWHHFAMVGNGTTCLAYLDGELWGQAKTYKAISGTTIYLNGWNSSTTYATNDTSISDFRIYATALTPAAIQELYHTSASIDKSGNVYAREVVEI